MQQMWQRMLVMHIGRGEHRAVHQPALAVHPDVQLRTEVVSRPEESHPEPLAEPYVTLG
jgi:hypothetical protein